MGRLKCLKPPLAEVFQPGWKPDAIRGSRHERGYGYEWEKLRKVVLERDRHLCQTCLAADPESARLGTQVDHIIPKAQGGTDDLSNLSAICADCHKIKTARESQA